MRKSRARCFSVDSIFNDLLSGYLCSQSVEEKKSTDSYTDLVTKREERETQTENVDLLILWNCSISKHLGKVLYATMCCIIRFFFEGPNCQFKH